MDGGNEKDIGCEIGLEDLERTSIEPSPSLPENWENYKGVDCGINKSLEEAEFDEG